MRAGAAGPVILILGSLVLSCTSVDVVRLTNQTFPPKASTSEVEVLDRKPPCPMVRLALLEIDESSSSFHRMQHEILEQAAKLGADAVVFDRPQKHVEHQVAYEPMSVYSPWGVTAYGYPGWGYGGFGMGGGFATSYDYTVRSLKGLALRYIPASGPKC